MSKIIAIVAGLSTLAVLGVTVWITQREAESPCGTTAVAGGDIGGPFELVNEDGVTVTDADVITEPTLVYFGYTFCPDVCPLDAARNAAAVDILAEQGMSVTPVFITIDPVRDTVEVVREYTDNFHPKMIGLTGSEEQIAAASQAYKTYYNKADDDPEYYLMQHSTFTYLMLPDKGFVEFFRQPTPAEEMAEITACHINAS
ncbi:SCO family protein [Yoonia sediminilitoris]|uniref:Protein SCO1/2 n=1 Tax=Yoonia sediminilitoris TaxID=1286148 RepID=A0A2T6KLZ2_9RHOB|nr:SCO family protein [Yoonia sediminilitoris]PUB17201.1 protein SCO1/2 [Yoonia sediminilitoris]RCW97496.1 protein SCO1/2 [Yoonia sediminilitoris]